MNRFLRRLVLWMLGIAAGLALLAGLVVVAASLIFARLQGIVGIPMPLSLWCWLPYWMQDGDNPAARTNLLISGGVPAAFTVLLVLIVLVGAFRAPRRLRPARPGQRPPAPERAASNAHGNAEWLTIKAARHLFPGPDPEYGGVVVGEAYRVDQDKVAGVGFDPQDKATWGSGGKSPLLIDPCRSGSTHGLVFAGSGGYKTTAIAVPTLAYWTSSVVVLDPSCQLGPMTAAMREAMKHKVVQVGPCLDGFNPVEWINIKDPLAETHVQTVVDWITGDQNSAVVTSDDANSMFRVRGKEMMTAILADLLWSDEPAEKKTIRTFRERICTPEKKMKGFLATIHAESKSPLAAQLAGALMDVFHETFSGIYSEAMKSTQWMSIAAYADMLSGDSFRTRDLCGGKLSVFVQIPMASLRTTPALARVVVGALMNAVYQAEGKVSGRVLFLLDEVNFLGRLKVLEDARDAGRKYGITLVPMWQSLGQLADTWGANGKASWFNSASWRLFSSLEDDATCSEVSKMCGTYTILKRTEGMSSGSNSGSKSGSSSKGRNEGMSEGSRELIRPEEIRLMREDDQILFRRGSRPLRSGRAVYFRRADLVARVEADRFRKVAAE